jgi:hypothetical protein
MTTCPCSCDEALALRAERDAALSLVRAIARGEGDATDSRGKVMATLVAERDALRAVLADTDENRLMVGMEVQKAMFMTLPVHDMKRIGDHVLAAIRSRVEAGGGGDRG